jgi:glyceraldehyde-3-phosphate dehydrogenase/erythrose-4-phosphate dehydrogenase
VTVETITNEIKCRAESDLNGVLSYTDQKLVSSDLIGSTFSAIVDLNQIEVMGKMVAIGVWYDNEIGYSTRVLDLLKHMAVIDRERK